MGAFEVRPIGSKCTERAHRVAYMTEHKVLKEEIFQRQKQEASHLCHNSLCVNTDHLCLESHETIWGEPFARVGDNAAHSVRFEDKVKF